MRQTCFKLSTRSKSIVIILYFHYISNTLQSSAVWPMCSFSWLQNFDVTETCIKRICVNYLLHDTRSWWKSRFARSRRRICCTSAVSCWCRSSCSGNARSEARLYVAPVSWLCGAERLHSAAFSVFISSFTRYRWCFQGTVGDQTLTHTRYIKREWSVRISNISVLRWDEKIIRSIKNMTLSL